MKTGSKYYGFKNWNENRVKIFREKEPENLGMKTWILRSKPAKQDIKSQSLILIHIMTINSKRLAQTRIVAGTTPKNGYFQINFLILA